MDILLCIIYKDDEFALKISSLLEIMLRITLICIWLVGGLWASKSWENNGVVAPWNEDAKRSNHLFEDCNESLENCSTSSLIGHQDVKRKSSSKYITLSRLPLDDPSFTYIPTRQSQPRFCSCSRENRLVDLGSTYFPRYVADMVCIPGGCGLYTCRPKRFKLWVMRKRQSTDLERGIEPIPRDLRDNWIAESIITTVDCECGP